jgi:hypothetical protein
VSLPRRRGAVKLAAVAMSLVVMLAVAGGILFSDELLRSPAVATQTR